jgi:hypothetical protein
MILGMSACSSEIAENVETVVPAKKGLNTTVALSLPQSRAVTFNADGTTTSSTFSTDDKLYIYNVTKNAFDPDSLVIKSISADGKKAEFAGTLTGDYSEGDEVRYYYNMMVIIENNFVLRSFLYTGQTGTAESASKCDYAVSAGTLTVDKISTDDMVLPAASLEKLQSTYRLNLKFEDGLGNAIAAPTSFSGVVLNTKNHKLAQFYNPSTSGNSLGNFSISKTGFAKGDLYLALRMDESENDALVVTATASDGTVYEGVKNAPTGGFVNGKYYYGTLKMKWKSGPSLPTITANDEGSIPGPNDYSVYRFYTDSQSKDINLTGVSSGYLFVMQNHSMTIRLNGLKAIYDSNDNLIYGTGSTLTLEINGDNNSISTPKYRQPVLISGGNIVIRGNGKLTITCKKESSTVFLDTPNGGSVSAADGYTLTIGDIVDNGDGTLTRTYTVRPNQ